jgi:ABC-type uncharacterized transport system auxiliary subunit
MAMRAKAAAFVLACALGSLCGCGGVPAMKYYTLTTPNSPPPAASAATFPVTIVVAPLRASQLYRDNRLVYATSDEAMGTYEYERWVQPPPQMIQEVLLRELRASARYRVVESFGSTSHGNFILRGNLYDFKELSGGPLMARVTLDMDLRDAKTGAILWTHNYTHDQPVASKDVGAVVAALNQNVQQGIAEISSSLNQFLDQYLASHPQQP